MSRVIKAAIWQTEPKIVEIPPLPKKNDASLSTLDGASRETLVAAILEKERKAEETLKDARLACEIMKQEARNHQETLLEEAKKEAVSIKEEARKAGYDAGFANGREEGAAQVRTEQQQIILDANAKAQHTLETANEETKAYLKQAEEDITDIALHIVNKILPQHFIDVPQVILPLVREALHKIRDQNEVIVHVAPGCYDMVLMARMEFQSMLEGNATLQVKSDESLSPGDCILESPNGNVDARLATQLELVKKALQDVML